MPHPDNVDGLDASRVHRAASARPNCFVVQATA
jgi:hypothetical protein